MAGRASNIVGIPMGIPVGKPVGIPIIEYALLDVVVKLHLPDTIFKNVLYLL